MVKVTNINYSYNKVNNVLKDISFDIKSNQFIAILGNNGAGKSTLLKCLNGIFESEKGSVLVSGENVFKLKSNEIAKKIAYVAQKNESSEITVYEAVLLGRKPYIKWDASQRDNEIVEELIEQMGLEEFKFRYIDELSGGELQKVMIARALAQQPKLLLLDEPTSSLDPKNQHEVLALIKKIAKMRNIAVVMVIHDLNLALRYCDRFLFIKNREIYAYGESDVVSPKCIEHVYEMPAHVEEYNNFKMVIPMPELKTG